MEHIKNIEIKNFKSIRDAKINDCRRVNVFIGPPNVGKSNILEAIGLLTFINNNPKGFGDLVRLEKLTQLFNFSNFQEDAYINFNNRYSLVISYEDEEYFKFRIRDKESNEKNPYYTYSATGISVSRNLAPGRGTANDIDTFSGEFLELRNLIVKPYKFSDAKVFNENISALELNIPFGRNMFEVIINNPKIKKEFSDLLKPYELSLIIDISENSIKVSPKIKDEIINTIPMSLIADTLQRLIFHKAAIASNSNTVLLFEEPEAHMFPPYISKFTSDIINDENNNQYFITTHSPFVLNDLIEELKEDQLAIFIVSYKKDTGETLINKMNKEEMHEAYQFGYDFFLNMENFIPVS